MFRPFSLTKHSDFLFEGGRGLFFFLREDLIGRGASGHFFTRGDNELRAPKKALALLQNSLSRFLQKKHFFRFLNFISHYILTL